MKKIFFLLLSSFATIACFSQNFTYQILDEANYSLADNITPTQNGFLHYEVDINKKFTVAGIGINKLRMGVKINKLDTALKLIASKDMLNGEKKLLPGLYEFFKFQNNHCIVYQDVKDEEILGNVKLLSIDETALNVKSETVLLDFEKCKLVYQTKEVIKNNIHTFSTRLSAGKKMLLTITEPATPKGEKKRVYLSVFDANLKMLMEKEINFKEDITYVDSYTCDDNGNVFICYQGSERDGGRVRKGDILDEGSKIMIIAVQTKAVTILPFKLEGHTLTLYNLVHSPIQNKIFIIGTYSKAWDENHLGVFYADIDLSTMALSKIKNTDFPEELVKKFDEDGYANSSKKKFGLSRYFSSAYTMRGDGSVDILLTYNKHISNSSVDSKGMPKGGSTTYYTGNILDAHLINNQFIFSRIPRDMSSGNAAHYLSFISFSKDANLTLLYNENEKNIEENINEKSRLAVVQKSEVCATTINSDGKVKRELLLKGYQAKTIGILHRIYPVSTNSFFILLQKLNFASMSTKDTRYAKIVVE